MLFEIQNKIIINIDNLPLAKMFLEMLTFCFYSKRRKIDSKYNRTMYFNFVYLFYLVNYFLQVGVF